MDDKEMKLYLLERARLNINASEHALVLFRDRKKVVDIKKSLHEEREFLKRWVQEIEKDGT